jgi:hypothetical protein
MANLKEIAELAWGQLFPNPGDETAVDREDFVATAKSEYAYQLWRKIKEDKREYGQCDIPSYLLSEAELEVSGSEMDISGLKIMRSIDQELWLQDVGGLNCECVYVKSTVNHNKALCDDDSLPDDARTYYPLGKKIVFPKGVHKTPLKIIYANNGEDIDDMIEVDDAIAGIVRRSLIEIYGGKTGKEDKTDNTNPNQ